MHRGESVLGVARNPDALVHAAGGSNVGELQRRCEDMV